MPFKDLDRKRSYQRNWIKQKTDRIQKIKESSPCADCGNFFPAVCMDFDHVRGDKVFNIAKLRTSKWERIEAEIAKCELVCSNCHRIRTEYRLVTQRLE